VPETGGCLFVSGLGRGSVNGLRGGALFGAGIFWGGLSKVFGGGDGGGAQKGGLI